MSGGRRLQTPADSEVTRQKGLILYIHTEEFEASRQNKVNFTLKRFASGLRARVQPIFEHLGYIQRCRQFQVAKHFFNVEPMDWKHLWKLSWEKKSILLFGLYRCLGNATPPKKTGNKFLSVWIIVCDLRGEEGPVETGHRLTAQQKRDSMFLFPR